MARNKYTVRDIARLAGVSPATVSRVMNHRNMVEKETAERVEAAINELGYIVKETHTPYAPDCKVILVNVVQGSNPFYSEVINGAITSAAAHGFTLLVNHDTINTSSLGSFIGLVRKVQAAGLITLSQIRTDILKQLDDIVPVIQCCEYNPESALPYVSIDDRAAAERAVEYLIHAGRHKIAMINGPLSYKYARERLEGFQEAMDSAELSVPSSWVLQVPEVSYDMACTVAGQLFHYDTQPNAVFAASDLFAAAVINAAEKSGLRVPEDLMVIGFDDLPLCQMTRPSITSVSQPKFQLGYTACEYLIEAVQNPEARTRSSLLSTDLIIRGSTK